jgi:hypothetical protein
MRKLMLLATLSVLVGVFVLSASSYADGVTGQGKSATKATTHQLMTAKPTTSTHTLWSSLKGGFGLWMHRVLGLPPVSTEITPPNNTEPQKSSGEVPKGGGITGRYSNQLDSEIIQDNGGSNDEM